MPPDDFSGDWLSQFLALRDISHFLVGASIQFVVYKETRDVRLLTSSAKTRNALLRALENMRLPPHLSKADLIATFTCTFRMILPDTPMLPRRDTSIYQADENEIDALDDLCRRLSDRNAIQRISDREMMHSISEITRNIAILDDPNGQFRSACPRLYALNCQNCHVAGGSQLRNFEEFKLPVCSELNFLRSYLCLPLPMSAGPKFHCSKVTKLIANLQAAQSWRALCSEPTGVEMCPLSRSRYQSTGDSFRETYLGTPETSRV